ncbi:hypothetical protein PAXRUDRAFT_822782 [Paxillus rubicundulus Ve08.2h10]|uniref:Uncharacterized protein n=1 Tax=Paxillus rubicundulus Ve08.2h10 TaxID=930991 RepID=A0A0D0DLG4_9AGAM|nr:hypothetical protein PAXRUDRAFT_822782 [Paxillus rubicundulus Ve08.2h10]
MITACSWFLELLSLQLRWLGIFQGRLGQQESKVDDKGGHTQSPVTRVNFMVGAVAMNSMVQIGAGTVFSVARRADLPWCRLCSVLLACSHNPLTS